MEYHGFTNLPEHREYRLTAYGPEQPAEFSFRVALAAFAEGKIRLQEAPDMCFQRLVQLLLLGETAPLAPVTFDDVELASYREAHTVHPRRRPTSSLPAAASPLPRPPHEHRMVPRPPQPLPKEVTREKLHSLCAGQRVSHALFGTGVTTEASARRTTVHFDEEGSRTFVSAMVELEVLSPPHTWETDRRGRNRPLETTPIAR